MVTAAPIHTSARERATRRETGIPNIARRFDAGESFRNNIVTHLTIYEEAGTGRDFIWERLTVTATDKWIVVLEPVVQNVQSCSCKRRGKHGITYLHVIR